MFEFGDYVSWLDESAPDEHVYSCIEMKGVILNPEAWRYDEPIAAIFVDDPMLLKYREHSMLKLICKLSRDELLTHKSEQIRERAKEMI